MQYYETRKKEHYDVAQDQSHQDYGQNNHGYGQSHQDYGQNNYGYGQSQNPPVYGNSPTLNSRSHGGFLDGLFKGQKGQSGIGSFLGERKNNDEANKNHGHGKLLGQQKKKTPETNKGLNGLGMFINNGEKKNKKEHKKKKNKDGHGSGNESSSGSDSD